MNRTDHEGDASLVGGLKCNARIESIRWLRNELSAVLGRVGVAEEGAVDGHDMHDAAVPSLVFPCPVFCTNAGGWRPLAPSEPAPLAGACWPHDSSFQRQL